MIRAIGFGVLSVAFVNSAFGMGKSPAQVQEMKKNFTAIEKNLETINQLRSDLGQAVELAPQIPHNPGTSDLDRIIVAQSLEISELQAKVEKARADTKAAVQKAAKEAGGLPNDPRISTQEPSNWILQRCKGLQDSLPNQMVSGRVAWSKACLKQYSVEINDLVNKQVDATGIADSALIELALSLEAEVAILGTAGQPWQNSGQSFYPTFGTVGADGSAHNDLGIVAPVAFDAINNCGISYKSSGNDTGPSASLSGIDIFHQAHYHLVSMCVSGCYTPEQHLLFKSGYEGIRDAMTSNAGIIQVVTSDSSLGHPQLQESEIESYTADIAPSWQDVLDLTTLSGKEVTVTTNHALLDSAGDMREASSFKVGESLVQADGTPDPIIQIRARNYYGKVYNIQPKSRDPLNNIVVAQGLLSGTVYYQNAGVRDLNRQLFRIHLPKEIVE